MPDPVAGSQYSSQGTAVSFGGLALGRLTSFDSNVEVGQLADITCAGSRLVGSGATTRVVESYDVTTVKPPSLTLGIFGPPQFADDDVGLKATLSFVAPGSSRSGIAVLTGVSHSGRAGQYAESNYSFQWLG